MRFNDTFQDTVEKIIINSKQVPMLLGEPGIGKSSWVEALGAKLHTKVFTLACNQLADKADLTGARLVPCTDSKGNQSYEQVFYPHAIIRRAIQYALDHKRETPILFLDELNRTTPDVTSELLSIPTLRSIGNTELPDNLRVITAGNDKGNVTQLDEASISRFTLFHVSPDVDTFLQVNPNLNPFVKNVLLHHPESIFCKEILMATSQDDDDDNGVDINEILDDGEDMNQITTPRTITGVSDWLNCYNNNDLMPLINEVHTRQGEDVSLLQEILEGFTGKTNFTKFLMAEIATNIMTINNQSNVINIGKPPVYDNMKQCASVDALNQLLSAMSDNDLSGCLVYALYEKDDNTKYINALASKVTTLTPNDMKTVMKLYADDQLDAQNVDVLKANKSAIAQTLGTVMI